MKLAAGTSLGPYDVLGAIGAGGMGEVYRARDTKLGRDVALKVLPDAFAADAERLARFRREARVLASLNHPNIAQIYGLEDSGATHALVLELVGGPTLADRLASGALALPVALTIANQIALALETAHDQGVIHRDLKPANIKVRDDGVVKVLDFGLAKAFDASPSAGPGAQDDLATVTSPAMTERGVILGTAAYMAPEQAKGKIVDKRADIWSFGVVLYEMLSGRRPFRADSVQETLAEVLKADLDWSAIPAGTPASIVQVLHRCLERDPKERLRDIGEARVLIQRQIQLMSSGVALADAPSTPHHTSVVIRGRRPAFWIAAAVAALAVVAAGAIWLSHVIAPAREARSFQVAAGLNVSGARISPNGRSVVFVDDGRLVVRDDIERLDKRVLEGTPGRAVSPFWSPDSASIAYFINNTVHVIPAAGGADRLVTSDAFANMGAAWCDSGIVVTRFARGLWLLADGGDRELAQVNAAQGERFVLEPACLPDGRLLAIVVMKGEIRNYIAVVDGTKRIPLTAITAERKQSLVFLPPGELLFVQSTPNPGIYALPVTPDLSRALGPPIRVLASDVVPPLSLSNDGTLVAMSGVQTTEEQMVWVDRNGKKVRDFGRPQTVHFLSASADGRHVAVTTGDEETAPGIFIHSEATSQRITSARGDAGPSWSPAGDRVAYISGDDRSLWVRPIAGGDAVLAVKGPVSRGEWASDGLSLVYASAEEGQRGFWVGAIAGTPPRRLLTGRGGPGAISSDGHFRAYTAGTTGRTDVYVTTFPVPGNATPVSVDGGRNPRWGPGSHELFYAGGPNVAADPISKRDLYAVTIDDHGEVKAGSRTRLFDASALGLALDHEGSRTYDVGPGGQSFIVRTTGQSGEPVIIAIQNLAAWMRKLK